MEARFSKTLVFKKIIDALKEVIKESVLDCNECGLELQAMDNSHVSLVSLFLSCEDFQKYSCKRNMSLGVDFNILAKVLRCANGDDALTISAKDKSDTICLSFDTANRNRVSEYEIRLLNLEQDHMSLPETEYPCVVRMPSMDFAHICRDLSMFGESVTISCDKQSITFSISGDMGKANIKRSTTDEDKDDKGGRKVSFQVEKPLSLLFGIRYLSTFIRATPLAEEVKLGMGEDVPLLVEYKFGDESYLRYYLAPKMDDNGPNE